MKEATPLNDTKWSQTEFLSRPDLKDIRVHDSRQASELAKRLGGEAFTSGSRTFGPLERFYTGTTPGAGLLSHEITHTMQRTRLKGQDFGASSRRSVAPDLGGRVRQHREAGQYSKLDGASRALITGIIGLSAASRVATAAVQRREDEVGAPGSEQTVIQAVSAEDSPEQTGGSQSEAYPRLIADLVYRMMLQDLVLERERRR